MASTAFSSTNLITKLQTSTRSIILPKLCSSTTSFLLQPHISREEDNVMEPCRLPMMRPPMPQRRAQRRPSIQERAAAAADEAGESMEDITGKMNQTAQHAAQKVKRTAEDAWASITHTTHKMKDTVVHKAEASSNALGEEAANVDHNIKSNK